MMKINELVLYRRMEDGRILEDVSSFIDSFEKYGSSCL